MASPSSAAMPVQLQTPVRFADFFFQCGLNPTTKLVDRRVLEDGSMAGDRNRQSADEFQERTASPLSDAASPMLLPEAKLNKRTHPLDWRFGPEVLCRYPSTDYSEKEKFPAFVSMFCFPDNIHLCHDDNGAPPETYHSFVITEETGQKLYGVTVTTYERLHSNHAAEIESIAQDMRSSALGSTDLEYIQHIRSQLAAKQEALLHARMGISDPHSLGIREAESRKSSITSGSPALATANTLQDVEEKVKLYRDLLAPLTSLLVDVENVYVPRSIGVLSHWPWHDFLKDWLCEVVRVMRGDYDECPQNKVIAPLERFVINLIHEIPLPPPGKLEISLHVGQLTLYCSRPPVNTISLLKNFSLYPLFRTLSIANIVTLFEIALSEQKIIFLSSHLSMLTLASESLCLFFFPLSWQHILIPVLPARLMSYLQAPMPYIIGVQREYFTSDMQDEWKPPDVNVVDLDNDTIEIGAPPFTLPTKERKKLVTRLEKATGRYIPFPSPGRPGPGLPTPDRVNSRLDKGVPMTSQYALPLNKHPPRSCESTRATAPLKTPRSRFARQHNTHLETPESASAKRRSLPTSPSGMGSAWLDRLNKTFSTNQVTPASGAAENASVSSGSSTATTETTTQSTWWGLGKDNRRQSIDEEGSLTSTNRSGASEKQGAPGSYGSLEKPGGSSSSEPGFTPRLRNVFKSSRASSKLEEKSMRPSGSTTSLSSKFSTLSNSHGARPSNLNITNSNHRNSISGASTTSSSITTSTAFSNYSQYGGNMYGLPEEGSGMQGVPLRRKEGHAFYTLSVRSPWSPGSGEDMRSETSGGRRSADSSQSRLGMEHGGDDDRFEGQAGGDVPVVRVSTASRNAAEIRRLPRVFSLKKGVNRARRFDGPVGDTASPSRTPDASAEGGTFGRRRHSTVSTAASPVISLEVGATCSLCKEELGDGENSTIMQCDVCQSRIHPACLPLSEAHPCPAHFDEHKIQLAFLKLFTSLLRHYRQHVATAEQLRVITRGHGDDLEPGEFEQLDVDELGQEWFKKEDFMAATDKETRPFMIQFSETQAFAQFILDRVERPESDYEVLFFDECIKEKKNRSKLRIGKESTPFLRESAYEVKSTVACLEPKGLENGDHSFTNQTMPMQLDPRLLQPIRAVQPLITPEDHRMMRHMTNDLVQRARLANNLKRKQDFSKWMKTKWRHFQKVGGGEVVALGFLSDEQRREMFDERIQEVTAVIDHYEQLHLSIQSLKEVRTALQQLHAQNLVLMRAADEEQLVDEGEQEDLQGVYGRLFRVITIYEDYMASLKSSGAFNSSEELAGSAVQSPEQSKYLLRLSLGTGLNLGSVSDWLQNVGAALDTEVDAPQSNGDLGDASRWSNGQGLPSDEDIGVREPMPPPRLDSIASRNVSRTSENASLKVPSRNVSVGSGARSPSRSPNPGDANNKAVKGDERMPESLSASADIVLEDFPTDDEDDGAASVKVDEANVDASADIVLEDFPTDDEVEPLGVYEAEIDASSSTIPKQQLSAYEQKLPESRGHSRMGSVASSYSERPRPARDVAPAF